MKRQNQKDKPTINLVLFFYKTTRKQNGRRCRSEISVKKTNWLDIKYAHVLIKMHRWESTGKH